MPTIRAEHTTETGVELGCYIAKELSYFQGHFPNAPILPGVVQLDWAYELGLQYLAVSQSAIKEVQILKYQYVIQPDMDITLKLEKKTDHKFTFQYLSEKGSHASGRIVLEES